jgi:hypothetical protein
LSKYGDESDNVLSDDGPIAKTPELSEKKGLVTGVESDVQIKV